MDTLRSGRPNPCNGCTDRHRACSDHCQKPEFLKWKAEQELIKRNRKAYLPPIWGKEQSDPGMYRKHKKTR